MNKKMQFRFAVGVKDFYLIWGPPGNGKTTVIPEVVINFRRNYLREYNKEPRILDEKGIQGQIQKYSF